MASIFISLTRVRNIRKEPFHLGDRGGERMTRKPYLTFSLKKRKAQEDPLLSKSSSFLIFLKIAGKVILLEKDLY